MNPRTDLVETRALVTGAARRIGREIAIALARAGARVAVHYRHDAEGAAETARACEAEHGRAALTFAADLATADACLRLVDEVETRLGPLDLLVSNAAIFERTPLGTLDADDFDRHLAVNARSVFVLSLEAGRRMKARGRGAIVNLTDVAAERAWPGYVAYAASKAAVTSLTRGFAKALAPEVRVNAVAPGPILPAAGATEAEQARAVESTLLRRWGAPADVADAVLFLARTPYVTGVVLAVDGGRSIG